MALLKAHAFFGEQSYFQKAVEVATEITARFKTEIYYDTELRHTQTPVRPRTLTDSGYPSPHGIAAEFFRELYLITANSEFLDQAKEILAELSALMARAPRATSGALYALVGLHNEVSEYAVVGANGELHEYLKHLPDDGSVISAGEPGETPLLEARECVEGKPTVYVCKSFSCKLPVTELAELKKQLEPDL
jgi:uncharacterized protein YyaL (SSP411 family)